MDNPKVRVSVDCLFGDLVNQHLFTPYLNVPNIKGHPRKERLLETLRTMAYLTFCTGLPKKKDPPNEMIIDLGKIAQISKEQPRVVLVCFLTSFWSFVEKY